MQSPWLQIPLSEYEADIEQGIPSIDPVELVYAALIFEYVRPAAALKQIRSLCRPGTMLATLVLLASQAQDPVSSSPYRTLGLLRDALQLVAPEDLAIAATQAGFAPLSSRRIALRSSKRFMLQALRFSQESSS